VFNIGAGVDALLKLRLPPTARVVRLDDAGMSVQMAEYVCHAVIRHFREFDGYEADVRQGRWSYRKPRSRADFAVGVMGLGVLGSRVAQALRVFEFPVNGWSRSPKALDGVRGFSGREGFNDFLAASRVLVNLLPLTPDTQDILNRDTLSRLQPGGYVINVARGAHLVDEDLLALLDKAIWRGPRWMCSAPSRCRPGIRSGPTPHHRHAPHLGADPARRKHRPDCGQDPGAGTGRADCRYR
jgi:glyoxylate/hydroxypyruvate reductase A